jgi:two-component system cell cycle response regulator DivK
MKNRSKELAFPCKEINFVTDLTEESAREREKSAPRRMKTILVVDDDDQNRKLFRLVLTHAGYNVIEASTGTRGIELAKTHRPHLILMDVHLPDIDGLEATVRIKSDPVMEEIPVLAVTAYSMKEDEERAARAGCAGYITKPVILSVLRHEVRRHLGEPEAPTQDQPTV